MLTFESNIKDSLRRMSTKLIHSHHKHHCSSLWGDTVREWVDEAELSGGV